MIPILRRFRSGGCVLEIEGIEGQRVLELTLNINQPSNFRIVSENLDETYSGHFLRKAFNVAKAVKIYGTLPDILGIRLTYAFEQAILFIDEAFDSYIKEDYTAHSNYTNDRTRFLSLGLDLEKIIVFHVRNSWAEDQSEWHLFPPSLPQPVPNIVACPRINNYLPVNGEPLTGQWLYDRVVSTIGIPESLTTPTYVFIDTSGSMNRLSISPALDDFFNIAQNVYSFRELTCGNERWLKWMYNVGTLSSECT